MKLLPLLMLTALVGCSSGKVKNDKGAQDPQDITKDSFKKEKPLNPNEVQDYYSGGNQTLNPALQDETLDRYSIDELEKISDNNDPLFEISLRCSKKDFDRAFDVASKAFNRFQKIPAYWNLVANCHLNQRNPRKALLFYNKALEIRPGYIPALNNIGVLYSRQGENQKALIAFERANKKSPFSKTPRYNLARLYLSYGLAESALPLFQGLLNESPTDMNLKNAVANSYFMLSDYQKAKSYFSQIPSSLYQKPEIGLNYAITLKKLGNQSAAVKIFESVKKPKSRRLKAYYSSVGSQLGVQ